LSELAQEFPLVSNITNRNDLPIRWANFNCKPSKQCGHALPCTFPVDTENLSGCEVHRSRIVTDDNSFCVTAQRDLSGLIADTNFGDFSVRPQSCMTVFGDASQLANAPMTVTALFGKLLSEFNIR
jgi:hypothetical protein